MKLSKSVIGTGVAALLLIVAVVAIASVSGQQPKTTQNNASKQAAGKPSPQSKSDGQAEAEKPVKVPRYTNEKYGVIFDHPDDWAVEENSSPGPDGLMPSEFTVNLNVSGAETTPTAVAFEVFAKDYNTVKSYFVENYKHKSNAKLSEADTVRSGKQGVHIVVEYGDPKSPSKTERYLFSVGDKTYSLSSVNEEVNQQRDGAYWDRLSKVYDSLELK